MWFSRPSACPALPCMNDESVFAAVCAGGLPTYSGNNLSAVEHEFERELIRERSLAGLKRYHREYQAGKVGKETRSRSGKNLPIGRPRRVFNRQQVAELRREGLSFREIASRLGVGEGTVRRVFRALAEATGTRQNPSP